ncbi:MAG TPA: anthranilate phosphoribosyltransferase [Rhizomicrobium sp.]|jgi:anthranilate phosphoribosyltransferase|nr:anthranilate phosphoribosyltransferase [Rhizomicrobium sp.]
MSVDEEFGDTLRRVVSGARLDANESSRAFSAIMLGEVTQARMAAFLTALAMRKPTVEEIVGAVRAMRASMQKITAPANALDLCGTGGDGLGTLNVSTAAAFVVAACGVPVAKHGNRNMSSRTGTADVLEALGVKIDLIPSVTEACLRETGFCFLFAPLYHSAMRHVAPVRREIGFRTVFNLIGPLSNPASVNYQLMGVFADEWVEPLAHVLGDLGTSRAWLVHGTDGIDEISIAAPTRVAVLENGVVTRREISPEDAGVTRAQLSAIEGGSAAENAGAIRLLLAGEPSAFRDIVLLNAAAALLIAGKATDLNSGALVASDSIDSGRAEDVLARVVEFCSRAAQ